MTGTLRAPTRHRRVRRILIGALAAVLAVGVLATGTWVFGFSRVFDVRAVAVDLTAPGKPLLSQERVTGAAQVPLGIPLARVGLDDVAGRVAQLPEVAEVTVSLEWPHTVRIEVTERSAAYVVQLAGQQGFRLVDASGVMFHQVRTAPKGLVRVNATQPDAELLSGLAEVVAALPAKIATRLDRIEAPTHDQVTLRLDGDVTVVWGSPEDNQLKSQVALALLEVDDVKTVDVSAPSHPTTR